MHSKDGPVTTIKITPNGEIVVKTTNPTTNFSSPKQRYASYLKGPHWKKLRSKKFAKAKAKNKYRCSICGETKALQVHHLRYKNLYDIKTSDLRILCDTCHSLTHKLIKTGELSYGKKNRKMFKVMRRKVLEEKKGLLLNKELDSEFSTIVTN